jgi:hypothetical protein
MKKESVAAQAVPIPALWDPATKVLHNDSGACLPSACRLGMMHAGAQAGPGPGPGPGQGDAGGWVGARVELCWPAQLTDAGNGRVTEAGATCKQGPHDFC